MGTTSKEKVSVRVSCSFAHQAWRIGLSNNQIGKADRISHSVLGWASDLCFRRHSCKFMGYQYFILNIATREAATTKVFASDET